MNQTRQLTKINPTWMHLLEFRLVKIDVGPSTFIYVLPPGPSPLLHISLRAPLVPKKDEVFLKGSCQVGSIQMACCITKQILDWQNNKANLVAKVNYMNWIDIWTR